MLKKVCRKCEQEKDSTEFAKFRRVCKACKAIDDKQYHAEYWQQNLEENRRSARVKMRARRLSNPNGLTEP